LIENSLEARSSKPPQDQTLTLKITHQYKYQTKI